MMDFRSKLPDVGSSIFATMSALAEQCGALNLGQGFPDFDPPSRLRQAIARFVEEGKNQYAPMAGLPLLRQRIATKLNRDYGCNLDHDREVTVTTGATEGIFAVVCACVSPGDEVIVLDPCYDSYEPAVRLQGGRCVHVPLEVPGFRIDFERLRSSLTPRTRLLIINFPHNPTGAVLTSADLDELASTLRETSVLLAADEVYEHIVFDGRTHQSVLRHGELRERSFAISSFGKVYHNTGWKVGWVAAPPVLTNEVRKVHQFLTFSTNTPAQWALAQTLTEEPDHLDQLSGFYQAKRDHFRTLLRDTPFDLMDVGGTYFQLVGYGRISHESDVDFAERLTRDAKVAVIPVSPFYAVNPRQRWVRVCFAKTDAVLERAAERLIRYTQR